MSILELISAVFSVGVLLSGAGVVFLLFKMLRQMQRITDQLIQTSHDQKQVSITGYRADYIHAAIKYQNHLHDSMGEWDGTRTELFAEIAPDLDAFLQHTMRMLLIETNPEIRDQVQTIHDADAEVRMAVSDGLNRGESSIDPSVVKKIEEQLKRIEAISQMVSPKQTAVRGVPAEGLRP